MRVAAWNVRSMSETGSSAQVLGEMEIYKVNILGVSVTRWTFSGILTLNSGGTVCCSGRMDGLHEEGVGIIMDKGAKKSLLGWEPVYSRIIRARLFFKYAKTIIIQCYAPTEQATEEEKIFSIKLSKIRSTKHHYMMSLL